MLNSLCNILCTATPQLFCCCLYWVVRWQLGLWKYMEHNGAKAGVVMSPLRSSSARICRFIFLGLLVSIATVSYYSWTTTVNNSMLQDRVDRLARDFSLTRNQRAAAETNLAECKNRVSVCSEVWMQPVNYNYLRGNYDEIRVFLSRDLDKILLPVSDSVDEMWSVFADLLWGSWVFCSKSICGT